MDECFLLVVHNEEDDEQDEDTASVANDEGPTTTEASGIFAEPEPLVQVVVKGVVDRPVFLDVEHDTRVNEVKMMIFEKTGVEPNDQVLTFGGHRMKGAHTLWYYDVKRDSTIWLSMRLGGSAPKGPRKDKLKQKVGNDVVDGDKKLSVQEKLHILKHRTTQMIKRVDEDGEKMEKADDAMIKIALSLKDTPREWFAQSINLMEQPVFEQLKKDMLANTGQGKKPMEWLCTPEVLSFFMPDFAKLFGMYKEMGAGLEAVKSSWRLCLSNSFMVEDGSIQVDEIRKAIDQRVKGMRDSASTPKMTAVRRGEIKAVIAMKATMPPEMIKSMVSTLKITEQEWNEVETNMDVDEDL
jgi:hypothetical protein